MTEHRPDSAAHSAGGRHDYLPAAGRDALLPFYDLLTRALGMTKVYDTLIAQAGVVEGMSVLEVGCGTGNVTIRVQKVRPGANVVGVDPDPRALDRAQRKARGRSGIHFERGYVQELPYEDGKFDRVLSSMMWHHLDDEAKVAAATEIFRVLRPGGALHLVDIGGEVVADDGLLARKMRRNPHAHGNLGDAIPRVLRGAGFDCDQLATHKQRVIGQLTYFRATRPG